MSDENDNKYPEHTRLKEKANEQKIAQKFLDWLLNEEHPRTGHEEGFLHLAFYNDNDHMICHIETRENLMGRFLGIDPAKLEAEKRAMLQAIRAENEPESDES